MNRPTDAQRRPRGGFTLVEILIVIAIIGLLVGLLVPAVMSAINRAKEAAVSTDINGLASSLTSFHGTYSDYPPSRILLMENGFFNTSSTNSLAFDSAGTTGTNWLGGANNYTNVANNDLTFGQLADRSVRYLRKFFPRVNLSTTGAVFPATSTVWYDFNGNGTFDTQPILLQGHECLVFFLGGITNHNSTSLGMSGWSRNPLMPFVNETTAPNRISPLFEFIGGRLVDDDGDGIPGYLDTLGTGSDGRFFAYFSAYGGFAASGAYDPNDVNIVNTTDDPNFVAQFRVTFPITTSSGTTNIVQSTAPNPYTASPTNGTAPTAFLKPQSFQIISAGRDRLYGFGGQYLDTGGGDPVPLDSANSVGGDRIRERDNLTNFGKPRLD